MIGFQRLSYAISKSYRSQPRHTAALINASVSSVDRQEPPQHQSFNFGTKWFSSQVAGKKKEFVADGYHSRDDRFDDSKPTIEYAKAMPTDYCGMRHEQILQLCVEGDFGARREALTRNIMGVDSIEYDEADAKVTEMWKFNQKSMHIHHIPYQIGLGAAVTGGAVSFPLIFEKNTVLAFNDKMVTTDVPCPADLETYLEVAMWSWNWMEPICGQVSFVLLVLQFARSQMVNMGIKPFGNKMKSIRSHKLNSEYPQYNSLFVRWFSEGDTLYGSGGK